MIGGIQWRCLMERVVLSRFLKGEGCLFCSSLEIVKQMNFSQSGIVPNRKKNGECYWVSTILPSTSPQSHLDFLFWRSLGWGRPEIWAFELHGALILQQLWIKPESLCGLFPLWGHPLLWGTWLWYVALNWSVKKIQPHTGHAAGKAERSIFLKSIVHKKEWPFFFF